MSALVDAEKADPADLIDVGGKRTAAAERAIDKLRDRFGKEAVVRGLAFEDEED